MTNKENLNTGIDDELLFNNDEDMKKLLTILQEVSELPLPDAFDERLRSALKYEGRKIREEAGHNSEYKRKKWYVKTIATLAACFLVVFASVTVYNNHGVLFEETDGNNMENIMEANLGADKEKALNDVIDENIDKVPLVVSEDGVSGLSAYGDSDGILKKELKKDSIAKNDRKLSTDNSAVAEAESGSLMDSGFRGASPASDESAIYLEKIAQEFAGYEYDIVSLEKNDVEEDVYDFIILIRKDSNGNDINEYVKLSGKSGELYDAESKKPEAGGN